MSFYTAFSAEMLKTRRTPLRYLFVPLALFAPLMDLMEHLHSRIKKDVNPWTMFISDSFQLSAVLMLPLYVLLLCTLLAQLEYRNNTWKQVLSAPQRRATVFFTRYLQLMLGLAAFMVALSVFCLLMPLLLEWLQPEWRFSLHRPDWAHLLKLNVRMLGGAMGMSAMLFVMTMYLRNFIAPIVFGFGLWLASIMLALLLRLPVAHYLPFNLYLYPLFEKYDDRLWQYMGLSAAYWVVFTAAGVGWMYKRELKG